MNFGDILELLHDGHRVCRSDWIQGKYLEFVPGIMKDDRTTKPHIRVTQPDSSFHPWVGYSSDLLAGDWTVQSDLEIDLDNYSVGLRGVQI